MPSDGLFHPSLDHIPPPREQLRNTTVGRSASVDVMGLEHSAAFDTYHHRSDSNPRALPRQTHLPTHRRGAPGMIFCTTQEVIRPHDRAGGVIVQ